MAAFAHVVVGFDGSEQAKHALHWVAQRVESSGLDVVHAGAPDPELPDDVVINSIHSEDGSPGDVLISTAAATGAEAIVIGPHGSGVGHGLGGVARFLLRCAPLPVLVVGEPEDPRSLDVVPPVVACVGYGEPASAAAEWAAGYAAKQQLPLVLLHAVAYRPVFPFDSASDVLASYLGTGVSQAWARDELTDLSKELALVYPDLDISTHVSSRSPIRAVRHAGETAEIVVLGKRNDEEFLHTIGTPRLRRLVARTTFPTAVVPCQPAR